MRWGYSEDRTDSGLTELWNSSGLYRYRRTAARVRTPYDGIETPGVSDPVEAAQLGLANLERSVGLVSDHDFSGEDPEVAKLLDPRSLHEAAFLQWFHINRQVLSVIGGKLLSPSLNSVGEASGVMGSTVHLVNKTYQAKAVAHLCEFFFPETPHYLVGGTLFERAKVDRDRVKHEIRETKKRDFWLITDTERFGLLRDADNTVGLGDQEFGARDLVDGLRTCAVR